MKPSKMFENILGLPLIFPEICKKLDKKFIDKEEVLNHIKKRILFLIEGKKGLDANACNQFYARISELKELKAKFEKEDTK